MPCSESCAPSWECPGTPRCHRNSSLGKVHGRGLGYDDRERPATPALSRALSRTTRTTAHDAPGLVPRFPAAPPALLLRATCHVPEVPQIGRAAGRERE